MKGPREVGSKDTHELTSRRQKDQTHGDNNEPFPQKDRVSPQEKELLRSFASFLIVFTDPLSKPSFYKRTRLQFDAGRDCGSKAAFDFQRRDAWFTDAHSARQVNAARKSFLDRRLLARRLLSLLAFFFLLPSGEFVFV
jgi:hypothetical protein